MQIIRKLLILLIFPLIVTCEYKEFSIDYDYHVAEFPGNKNAAISYTFDDNCPSSFSTIAPLFKEYGYGATFFIISKFIKNDKAWQKWRALNDSGFEIGNHTSNHRALAKMTNHNAMIDQINESYDLIKAKIGQAPFSFAHPFHNTNDSVDAIVFQKHFASRMSPKGFCNWWGIMSRTTQDDFDSNLKETIKNHRWLVIAGHGVNDGYGPISKSLFSHMLAETKSKEDDLFIGTFGAMAKYKIEKNSTRITSRKGQSEVTIKLESSLDTTVFNYPLTLVVTSRLLDAEIEPLDGTKILRVRRTKESVLIDLLPNSSIVLKNIRR